jgi:hypothetical protein
MVNFYADDRYNTTFDLNTLEEDNYVYLRCKSNFAYLYEYELTTDLYKELVIHLRNEKNKLSVVEANDFLEYIHFVHNGITYKVKFNVIDQLIKSFDYLRKSFCRKHDFPLDGYVPQDGLRDYQKIKILQEC